MRWGRIAPAALLAALLVAGGARARDLNRQNYLIGEQAAGMGGAYVAMGGDPASSYYNPAGLAQLYRQGLSLSASIYQADWERYDNLLDVDRELQTDLGSESFSTFPASVVYALPLGGRAESEPLHHVLAVSVLVPDHDHFEARLDQPAGVYPFELKGTFFNEDETYWAGPSYAIAIGGRLRLGLSVFALVHLTSQRSNLGLKARSELDGAGVDVYTASSLELFGWSLGMLAQAGAQLDLGPRLCLGLTVRSQTFGTFASSVEGIAINSYYAEDLQGNPVVSPSDPGYVDRIELEGVELNHVLPWMIAVGAAYRVPGSWSLALDLSLHLPVDRYALFAGRALYPQDPQGQPIADPGRAVDPTSERRKTWLLNANLGAEIEFLERYRARIGFFTDLSAVDAGFHHADLDRRAEAAVLPVLKRFGLSLGGTVVGQWATTSFALIYVFGFGETYGLNEAFGLGPNRVDVEAHTLTLVLAGSANL